MKKLFVVLIMLFAFTLNAQWSYDNFEGAGGTAYGIKLTISDSTTASYTSKNVDVTAIDAQTIYFTWSFVQANFGYSAGNDTLQAILQGVDVWGGITNIDTLCAGNIMPSYLTKSAGLSQYTIVPSAVYPEWRLFIKKLNTGTMVNGKNSVLYMSVYSKVNDALYK